MANDPLPAVPNGLDPMAPLPTKFGPVAANGQFSGLPLLTTGMTFTEVGNSGLRQFSGWVREEFLPQLQGRQAARVYREMSNNSPIIGGLLFAIKSTMRKVQWRAVPADDSESGSSQECLDFADSLREDMSHTWEDLIVENNSMLEYGYAPHEIVYKRRLGRNPGMEYGKPLPGSQYDDGKIGWRRIPLRGQDTVLKWFFDENQVPIGMTQQPWVGPIINLPMEKMLLFRPSNHKNNPEGYSILRNAYRPYYFVKRLEEQEAITYERLGGWPMVRVPMALLQAARAGDSDSIAALNEYKRIAVNVRIDEQMGGVFPSDTWPDGTGGASQTYQYDMEFKVPQQSRGGGGGAADAAITRHSTNMLMSCMADFLALGHGMTGTQALSVNKTDMFFQAIEGFLNSNAAVYNRYGLPRIWELNGLDYEQMPKYQPDMAMRMDLDVLSNFVLRLSQAGMMLFPNQDIESFLLDAGGMPDVSDATSGMLQEQLDMFAEQQAAGEDRAQESHDVGIEGSQIANENNAGGGDAAKTDFGKMILASIARRYIRHAGGKSNIVTKRSKPRGKRR